MALLLRHGYNDLGLVTLLEAAATPQRFVLPSHFKDKEDFALQVIDEIAFVNSVVPLKIPVSSAKKQKISRDIK
jgi:hypothetical protein